MNKMHNVPYEGNPSYQKTIAAVRSQYFFLEMRKDTSNYIERCIKCQNVKVVHKRPTRFFHPFPILKFRWDVVTIDFNNKFPKTKKQHDYIMVVVDKLTKVAHFVPIKSTHKEQNIT